MNNGPGSCGCRRSARSQAGSGRRPHPPPAASVPAAGVAQQAEDQEQFAEEQQPAREHDRRQIRNGSRAARSALTRRPSARRRSPSRYRPLDVGRKLRACTHSTSAQSRLTGWRQRKVRGSISSIGSSASWRRQGSGVMAGCRSRLMGEAFVAGSRREARSKPPITTDFRARHGRCGPIPDERSARAIARGVRRRVSPRTGGSRRTVGFCARNHPRYRSRRTIAKKNSEGMP